MIKPFLQHPAAKPLVFAVGLGPLVYLVGAAWSQQLGANPAEAIVRSTGDWTLRFLCAVLAVTPLRLLLQTPALARFRRMLGLLAFGYGVLHFLSYSWFDMGFEVNDITQDIAKRPFILVGFCTLLVLSPLALTSFNRAIKTLGAKRWQMLHRLVYLAAPLALLHFYWMRAGKQDFAEVFVYATILGVLLLARVRWRARAKRA